MTNGSGLYATMRVYCPACGAETALSPHDWRCACGGAWEPVEAGRFDPGQIDRDESTIWRYRHLFDVGALSQVIDLGAGWTPLLPALVDGLRVFLKVEYFAPTASFKDRGTSLMISLLASAGVTHVVDDSSGNAGASVAAHAAAAGMRADIFVPAYASPAKQKQIAIYGAEVHPTPGPRENAKLAAFEAARQGAVLASHAYHPGFLLGQESVAWEIWEQLGRHTPEWYVVPVGQGVHLLGAWLGFRRLRAAGLIERLPRLVGVQPCLLAPVVQAFSARLDHVPAVVADRASIAEGLAIAAPVRGSRMLEALYESDGLCVTVEEPAILAAQRDLARRGLYVEPTSATVIAALPQLAQQAAPADRIVLALTGSGLKGSPTLPNSSQ